jgi:hypothetical protein
VVLHEKRAAQQWIEADGRAMASWTRGRSLIQCYPDAGGWAMEGGMTGTLFRRFLPPPWFYHYDPSDA